MDQQRELHSPQQGESANPYHVFDRVHPALAATHSRDHSLSISSYRSRPRTTESTRETRDPELDIGLPYRTLNNEADMAEYRTETPAGQIEGPPLGGGLGDGGGKHYHLTTFKPNDPDNPKNWSTQRKWYCQFSL